MDQTPKPKPEFDWAELDRIEKTTVDVFEAGIGFTVPEYAKHHGIGESRARERVRRLVKAGIFKRIGARADRDTIGRLYTVPLYDIVRSPEGGS